MPSAGRKIQEFDVACDWYTIHFCATATDDMKYGSTNCSGNTSRLSSPHAQNEAIIRSAVAQNGRISKLAATAAGVLGIRAVGQASAEGTLEMLGKCRGERKTQEFLLQEMERLGYKGGSVRIGHCGNAAFSLELYTELRRRFPNADVRRYPLRGLCSYYAERGGIMMGFET